jgi:hypothetical protein
MSLWFRDERLLSATGAAADRSEPQLALMLAMFAGLPAGERVPGHEQLLTLAGRSRALAGRACLLAGRTREALRRAERIAAAVIRSAVSPRFGQSHRPASGQPAPPLP